MFEILTVSLVLFFAIVGVSELLHRIWIFILNPKRTRKFMVIILDNSCAVEQITAALEDMRWNGKNHAELLIGINCGLAAEAEAECRDLADFNEDFILSTPEKVGEEILKRG